MSNNKAMEAAKAASAKVSDTSAANRLYQHVNNTSFIDVCQNMNSAKKHEFILNSITEHSKRQKLDGFMSISTSCLCNSHCMRRQSIEGSICSRCYAKRFLKMRKTLREKLERNYIFYNSVDLQHDEIPLINALLFRFESFGEVASVQCAVNYIRIAKKNPHCLFTVWSKEAYIWHRAISAEGKPDNLRILLSTIAINDNPATYEDNLPQWADGLFTTYNSEPVLSEKNVNIMCTGNCAACMECYTNNNFIVVHEKAR